MKLNARNGPIVRRQNEVPGWGPTVYAVFGKQRAVLIYLEQLVKPSGDRLYIYWSGCNFFFEGKDGMADRGGYAGIQHQHSVKPDGAVFTYNNICSVWDLVDLPPDVPLEVSLDYGLEGLYSTHGGEGTGLHTSHPMPWTPGHRYGMALRRWYKPGENVTRMAMFMYSFHDNRWTHYMSVSVPGPDMQFKGDYIAGFLQCFGGDALGYHGQYGQYFRMDEHGDWETPSHYVAEAEGSPRLWNAQIRDSTDVELLVGRDHFNTQPSITLRPTSGGTRPYPVSTPVVTQLLITYQAGVAYVSWTISDQHPPMLEYFIRIHEQDDNGKVVAENSDSVPERRSVAFETGLLPAGRYAVSFYLKDIFDGESGPAYKLFDVS